MDKLNILFPVETINRELNFRLFLACLAVKPDNRVFVGQHDVIDRLSQFMQGGVYVGKNIFKSLFPGVDITKYVELKKRKFKLIYLDEEGAVYEGKEQEWRNYLMQRLNPNYLCADDYVCTWGEFQAEFYKDREPACKENIRPTGHPAFDLYKPAYREFFAKETNELRERYGDFILINTNLGVANNGLGLADTFSPRFNFRAEDVEVSTHFMGFWAHTKKILTNFVTLLNRLSYEFPDEKFILRPHPSEDWSFYKTIFKDYKNVRVLHEGAVGPWLLAAKMVIHDGCTTGIEAFLGDCPVVSYKSIPSEKYDIFMPDEVAVKCFTEDAVVEQVRLVREGKFVKNQNLDINPLVAQLMANFKQDSFASLLAVIAEVEETLHRENTIFEWNEARFASADKLIRLKDKAKSTIRPLFREKQAVYTFYRSHFLGFKPEVIASKMETIQKVLKKKINYKLFGNDLILVETK